MSVKSSTSTYQSLLRPGVTQKLLFNRPPPKMASVATVAEMPEPKAVEIAFQSLLSGLSGKPVTNSIQKK